MVNLFIWDRFLRPKKLNLHIKKQQILILGPLLGGETMPTYVIRNGKLVEKQFAEPLHSGDQATYVISDTMPETQHMASGRWHTSKAEFRKDTKAAGCIEYGNESKALLTPRKPIPLDRGARREAIRKTIYDLRNGRR
jgi:hypothetical protein